jgi:HTH-type transcriptional regulator/antitoxin HigA
MKKLLKTPKEHAKAMKRLEELLMLDPADTSAEGEEIELLGLLIDNYEKEKFPIERPSPTEAIRFRMEQMDLKQKDLIPMIGSRSRVSEILSGKRPLTLQMARELHAKLKIPADLLLGKEHGELPDEIDTTPYPVQEMHKLGWFRKWKGKRWAEVKDQAEEMLQELFGGAPPTGLLAYNRTGFREGTDLDEAALAGWRHHVLREAATKKLPPYKKEKFSPAALNELARKSSLATGLKQAIAFLEDRGVAVVIASHLSKTYLDGAALLGKKGRPVIGLTLRHNRLDNFWYTLFHELGHVLRHLNEEDDKFFDDTESGDNSKKEAEANQFALNQLIPEWEWQSIKVATQAPEIRKEAKRLGIHPSIIAGRLRKEAGNYSRHPKLVGQGEVRKALGVEANWPT